MKLLIAEDEAIIRMDLKETLQDLGYEIVAEARSGREAVQKAFAFAPDCALMDAHMDGDDGFTAAQEIAQAQLCPVVMVTAYAQTDKVKEASKMGGFRLRDEALRRKGSGCRYRGCHQPFQARRAAAR